MRLTNFIKTLIRNIILHRGFSLISLLGLSVGIAMGLLVLIYVYYESNYDRYLPGYEQIHRIYSYGKIGEDSISSALTPRPIIGELKDLTGVEASTRFIMASRKIAESAYNKTMETSVYYADPQFFKVFPFRFLLGDPLTAMNDEDALVLTLSASQRLFGSRNPLGEKLTFDNGLNYRVSGVIADVPPNSHFSFDIIAAWQAAARMMDEREARGSMEKRWLYLNSITYCRLSPEVDPLEIAKQITESSREKIREELLQSFDEEYVYQDYVHLQFGISPIHEIYLHSQLSHEQKKGANPTYIFILMGIAFFILLVTAINFMNLTTAKPSRRFKEVAARRYFGASRLDLVYQFFTESIAYSFIALTMALVLVELLLPLFIRLFNIEMALQGFVKRPDLLWILIITLITGAIAGSYPALFFSGQNAVAITKGPVRVKKAGLIIRGILVVLQTGMAMTLITLTIAMYGQIHHLKKLPHGCDHSGVIVLERGTLQPEELDKMKLKLRELPNVIHTGEAYTLPGEEPNAFSFRSPQDSSIVIILDVNYVDAGFFHTLGVNLISGRLFTDADTADRSQIIVNETAARLLGYFDDDISHLELVRGRASGEIYRFSNIGIINDIHFESRKYQARPMVFMQKSPAVRTDFLLVKIDKNHQHEALNEIKTAWKSEFNENPVNHFPLSDRFNDYYSEEIRFARIATMFAILACILALIGTIGMVTFVLHYHQKNIEIKKAMAAPIEKILLDSFGGAIGFIFIGMLLAIPLSHFGISMWLSGFESAFKPSFLIYLFAMMLLTIVSILVMYLTGIREMKEK